MAGATKPYEPGRIVGGFEVIQYLGRHRIPSSSNYASIYRVRCTSCGRELEVESHRLRCRYLCECKSKLSEDRECAKRRVMRMMRPTVTESERWMTDHEIYRHYSQLADKSTGITILAELNDISERAVKRILHEQKEKELTQ